MTIPMRPPTDGPGAAGLGTRRAAPRPTRPTGPDPLAPLLDLPGVRDAADAARTAVDRLLGHKVLRRESAGVSSESALRGARASASLEGVDVPLAQVRTGDVSEPTLQGALRVSVALGSMVDTWDRAPGQVLARMHVLAAADLVPTADLGRPSVQASGRLGGVFGLITGATTAPAVLIAAVVHGELAAVEPFAVGSGVVARAAGRLTGIARGLDPKAVSVPEVGFAELGAPAYAEALAGYRSGTADGVAGWLAHCCRATELGAVEGLAICESLLRG
ncbi:oxidoreductase [Klenkia soli]|nr:oxidoreductase [Klenkia soli]